MTEKLYDIISICMGGTVFFTFGLCFLFLSAAESPRLRSYLAARRVMACAYLFLAGCNVVEYLSRSPGDNIRLTQMITLVIGCSQSFLFTGIFITLINPQFLSGKKIMRQAGLFLLFVTALAGVYFLCPAERFHLLLAVYALLYAFLLIRLTRMFLANYRRYTLRMDNFYSGGEARHLKWVCVSFFAALAIGVAALLNALFMSAWGALLFSVVVIAFYAAFAIRFLNYPFAFRYLEQAMDDAPADESPLPPPGEPAADNSLERRIEQWVAEKRFTEEGITIDTLAVRLGTNRNYLSRHINTVKQQTFRNWINTLRIEEAKTLMCRHPDMTVGEIALRVGIPDKSNFTRRFGKQTSLSPQTWRKQAGRK